MKKWLKDMKKDQRGLTLVELLAVVVILAIVAAIAFILIGNVIENSRKDAHISNAQQLIAAAKLYEANGNVIGEGGVDSEDLTAAGVLGPLTSPWKDTENNYTGTVYVETTGNQKTYRVQLSHDNCNINATESALNSEDRNTICSSGSGSGGSGG